MQTHWRRAAEFPPTFFRDSYSNMAPATSPPPAARSSATPSSSLEGKKA